MVLSIHLMVIGHLSGKYQLLFIHTTVTHSSFAGSMSNGYQQSLSEFSISSSGSMVSSSGIRGMTSQMIPTPGFNSNNTQSFVNLESSNDTGAFSTVGTSTISQPLSQKQHVGGQNSRILHNLGSHIGGGIRSGLQQKAYGFPNGGLGIMQRNSQLINGPGNSEGFLVASSNDNSTKPLPQHYDQHQRPMMHGTPSLLVLFIFWGMACQVVDVTFKVSFL